MHIFSFFCDLYGGGLDYRALLPIFAGVILFYKDLG